MPLFKPDPAKLKQNANVKGLIKALKYQKDSAVRSKAAEYLADLGKREAIQPLVALLVADKDSTIQWQCAKSLERLGYEPDQGEAGARYWNALNNYAQCAACGAKQAIPLLLQSFIALQEADWSFYARWREAYISLGEVGMPPFIMLTENIYGQYKNFIAPIRELNFMRDEDKRKSVVIKHFAAKLAEAAKVIGAYGTAKAAVYNAAFHARVKSEVYTVAEGGFSDIYAAEVIRRGIVESFRYMDERCRNDAAGFLADILTHDPSKFVRWEAVDVLRKWPLQQVYQNAALQQALSVALQNEPDSVSSRKKYILEMKKDKV